MRQGLMIAGATYRLMGSLSFQALAAMAVPYAISITLVYAAQTVGYTFRLPFDIAHGLAQMVFVAALLRAVLSSAPLSPRALLLGRDELHMLGVGLCLALMMDLISYAYTYVFMKPFMMLLSWVVLPLGSEVSFLVFMGAHSLVFLYFAFRLVTALPLIVKHGVNFADAIKQSWAMTRGSVVSIFVAFCLLAVPIGAVLALGTQILFQMIPLHTDLMSVFEGVMQEYIIAAATGVFVAVCFQVLARPEENR